MKRVLITGATGALGRAVIERIQQLNTYQIFATSSSSRPHPDTNKITFSLCDFSHLEQLTEAYNLARPDLILHLGAVFTDNLSDAYRMNVAPAAHLLELVQRSESKARVILIGSAAEYGVIKSEENPISEQHVLFPVSAYGVSKAWQTQLLGFYANYGVDVLCIRIFNLFGTGVSEKLFAGRIQQQINAVKLKQKSSIEVGSLAAIRDYISTSEAAHQLMVIATRGISGNVYHIGSGRPITMREFLITQLEQNGLCSSLIHEAPMNSNRCGYDVPIIFANMQKTQNLELLVSGVKNV